MASAQPSQPDSTVTSIAIATIARYPELASAVNQAALFFYLQQSNIFTPTELSACSGGPVSEVKELIFRMQRSVEMIRWIEVYNSRKPKSQHLKIPLPGSKTSPLLPPSTPAQTAAAAAAVAAAAAAVAPLGAAGVQLLDRKDLKEGKRGEVSAAAAPSRPRTRSTAPQATAAAAAATATAAAAAAPATDEPPVVGPMRRKRKSREADSTKAPYSRD